MVCYAVDRDLSLDLASGKISRGQGFSEIMQRNLAIPIEGGNPTLDFVRGNDRTKAIELFVDLASKAPDNSVVRFAGGCKGFTADLYDKFVDLVVASASSADGKRAFRGVAFSGGTAEYNKDGEQQIMVTQAPTILGRVTDCITAGTTPQTSRATLDVNSKGALNVSKYGAKLDYGIHSSTLVQGDNVTSFLDWDGDLNLYTDMMETCQRHGYKTAVVAVNGGPVTKDEILLALSKGIPVILVEGSLRAADEFIQAIRSGDPETAVKALYEEAYSRNIIKEGEHNPPSADQLTKLVKFAHIDSPPSLSKAFDELGLLAVL